MSGHELTQDVVAMLEVFKNLDHIAAPAFAMRYVKAAVCPHLPLAQYKAQHRLHIRSYIGGGLLHHACNCSPSLRPKAARDLSDDNILTAARHGLCRL